MFVASLSQVPWYSFAGRPDPGVRAWSWVSVRSRFLFKWQVEAGFHAFGHWALGAEVFIWCFNIEYEDQVGVD